MKRFSRFYIISQVLALAGYADAQTPVTSAIQFTVGSFAPSAGPEVPAELGTLTVPKNRHRGSTGTISIPVVRFVATDAASLKTAPIIYLSGGSGSGVAAFRGSRFAFFQSLRALGDVVTFDLRGAGTSLPAVNCPEAGTFDVSSPSTLQSASSSLRDKARVCAATLSAAGVDLQGHNIGEIVEDIEALRIGLGAPKIRLIGISTGSQIALEYMRRHGNRTERVVLAGVQGPDQQLHSPVDQEIVVRELSRRLVASGQATADFVPAMKSVFDSLEARPRVVLVPQRGKPDSLRVGLGKFDAQVVVSATLGDRSLMKLLPTIIGAAAKGDFVPLASLKAGVARSGISAFELLSDCQTGATPARLRALTEESKTALLGPATLDFPDACPGWGVKELDPTYRAPVRSKLPVLIVSGTIDGRTPLRNAAEVKSLLPNATQVIIDGASHGDDLFLSTPELGAAITAFLRGEKVHATRLTLSSL